MESQTNLQEGYEGEDDFKWSYSQEQLEITSIVGLSELVYADTIGEVSQFVTSQFSKCKESIEK